MPRCFGWPVLSSISFYIGAQSSAQLLLELVFFAHFDPGPASLGSLERLETLLSASWRTSGVSEGTDTEESKLDVREK